MNSDVHTANEPWNGVRPDPSQSSEEQRQQPRTKKISPSRVTSKPADQVLTSMISSFATQAPVESNESPSHGGRKGTRPKSLIISSGPEATFQRYSSATHSQDDGVGVQQSENFNDGALSPTAPTSHRTLPLTPTLSSKRGHGHLRLTPSSRRSSFSATSSDLQSPTRNKLSAESWVRKGSTSEEVMESSRLAASRKSSRRSLLYEGADINEGVPSSEPTMELPSMPVAEHIIAKQPTKQQSTKDRLYLTDASINDGKQGEESSNLRPDAHQPRSNGEAERRVSSSDIRPTQDRPPSMITSSPITDSIPTRTSSLRRSVRARSPPPGKKKGRKSARSSMASDQFDGLFYKRSKPVPESKWADLGEDDETVRRIRELEKRKSRVQEETRTSLSGLHPMTSNHPMPSLDSQAAARKSREEREVSRTRDAAQRALIGSANDATIVSSNGETASQFLNEIQTNGAVNGDATPDASSRTKNPLDVKTPSSAPQWPLTPNSHVASTPQSPLDYNYAQAVDSLDDTDQSSGPPKGRKQSHENMGRTSLGVKRVGNDYRSLSPAPTDDLRPRSRKGKKSSPEDLLTVLGRSKSRSKSAGDGRGLRVEEEEFDLARLDSVEHAVITYLRAPRLSHKLQNPVNGRAISFSEVGDPNGAAVFVCVGMGLTRFVSAFYDDLATTLQLRLITLDRPGVGGSEPYPAADKSGPLNWPDDVLAVCDYLDIAEFGLVAHSAGAIYALATALVLPHMIKGKVHLMAPWIPPSQLEVISHSRASAPPAGALPRSQRILRVLPTPFLRAANSGFIGAPSASLKPASKRKASASKTSQRQSPSPNTALDQSAAGRDRSEYNRRESMMLMDRFMPTTNPMENFPISDTAGDEHDPSRPPSTLVLSATASPMEPSVTYASVALDAAEHTENERKVAFKTRLTELTWELATRDSNPATDLLVCLERQRDIGFRYTDVNRDVIIHHGSDDKRVPIANVKWLAEQMNRRAVNQAAQSSETGYPRSREGWVDSSTTGSCEVRILPGEGHGLMANPLIMSDVLTEIAEYWAGQRKMT